MGYPGSLLAETVCTVRSTKYIFITEGTLGEVA